MTSTDTVERERLIYIAEEAIDNVHDMDVTLRDYARAATDAIIAALPDMVVPLVWDDFEGMGAKSPAWNRANYLITRWSNGEFELVESYPGYQGCYIAESRYPTIEAAKAAAQADYTRRIMSALGTDKGEG